MQSFRLTASTLFVNVVCGKGIGSADAETVSQYAPDRLERGIAQFPMPKN